MNVTELKEVLPAAEESWLENQYPGRPQDRYAEATLLNYGNIEDCFDREMSEAVERFVMENPDKPLVILAKLGLSGSPLRKAIVLTDPEANYYGHYELFACAFRLNGFVEVFHNVRRLH